LPILAPPFGLYDPRTVRLATEEGLTASLSLDATLLDDDAPRDLIPRFCMSSGHQPWTAVLYALGWLRGNRLPDQRSQPYPDLPSATT
jgi:hypothetical protein